ncbi:hypothetical protein ACLB2K_060616 [Fragaria x ananassa]
MREANSKAGMKVLYAKRTQIAGTHCARSERLRSRVADSLARAQSFCMRDTQLARSELLSSHVSLRSTSRVSLRPISPVSLRAHLACVTETHLALNKMHLACVTEIVIKSGADSSVRASDLSSPECQPFWTRRTPQLAGTHCAWSERLSSRGANVSARA